MEAISRTTAVVGWAVVYGGLRVVWAAGEAPSFPPLGSDLVGFTGWWSVPLCAAAGVLAVLLHRVTTWQPALAAAAWAVAQAVVGFDGLIQNPSVIALEVGMLLAGGLLPLGLVHRWGQVRPRWVPLVAGRTIPRLLLLIPGFGLGAGLVAYFGTGFVQLASGSDSEFSDAFLITAMSAYVLWGISLLIAAADYRLRTRRPCGVCAR